MEKCSQPLAQVFKMLDEAHVKARNHSSIITDVGNHNPFLRKTQFLTHQELYFQYLTDPQYPSHVVKINVCLKWGLGNRKTVGRIPWLPLTSTTSNRWGASKGLLCWSKHHPKYRFHQYVQYTIIPHSLFYSFQSFTLGGAASSLSSSNRCAGKQRLHHKEGKRW